MVVNNYKSGGLEWISGVLGHLCAHIKGYAGPGEPPEDTEINEMTLPSRYIIIHLSGLRMSTLPVGYGGSHNTIFLCMSEV